MKTIGLYIIGAAVLVAAGLVTLVGWPRYGTRAKGEAMDPVSEPGRNAEGGK